MDAAAAGECKCLASADRQNVESEIGSYCKSLRVSNSCWESDGYQEGRTKIYCRECVSFQECEGRHKRVRSAEWAKIAARESEDC